LNRERGKIMSSNVVSSIDKHKASQVAHGVQQTSIPTAVGNVVRVPRANGMAPICAVRENQATARCERRT
jgi:hypothetical protein